MRTREKRRALRPSALVPRVSRISRGLVARAFGAVVALSLGGCGASQTRVDPVDTAARAARARAADALAGGAGASHTFVVTPLGAPRVLLRDAEARVAMAAVGGVRVQLEAGRAEAAPSAFASELVATGRDREGFWFVTASGTVARAPTYLGALERVGAAPAATVRALAAARSDELSRAAQSTTNDEAALAARAALERFRAARLGLRSTLLVGDSVVLQGEDALHWARVGATLALAPERHVEIPVEARGECTAQPFGTRVLWQCATGRSTEARWWRSWALGADGVEAMRGAVPGRALAGRDGRTVTYPGPCMGARERVPSDGMPTEERAHACTHDRVRGWREWEYPHAGRILDVYDDLALVAEQHDGATSLALYEIDTAQSSEVLLSEPAATVQRAGFTADGSVLVLAAVGGAGRQRSVAGVSRAGRPVLLRSLGFLARDVSMADARRGMAVGANASEIAITTDGGLSWSSTEALVDGSAARVSLDASGAEAGPGGATGASTLARTGERVDCSSLACRAGGRVLHLWTDVSEVSPVFE